MQCVPRQSPGTSSLLCDVHLESELLIYFPTRKTATDPLALAIS